MRLGGPKTAASSRRITLEESSPFSSPEPRFVSRRLSSCVRFCKQELGISVSIISNGSLVTEDWLREYGHCVDVLGVSCDSFVEATNQRIGRSNGKKARPPSARGLDSIGLGY